MAAKSVSENQIQTLIDEAEVSEFVFFDKMLVRAYKLTSGFILVVSEGCIDAAKFDLTIGRLILREKAENALWQLEGYKLQNEIHDVQK
jgi:hypothetical protein